MGFSGLTVGNNLKIRGRPGSNGIVIATEIEQKSVSPDTRVIMQAVAAISGTNVTMLGITFDASAMSTFKDSNDNVITQSQFFAAAHLWHADQGPRRTQRRRGHLEPGDPDRRLSQCIGGRSAAPFLLRDNSPPCRGPIACCVSPIIVCMNPLLARLHPYPFERLRALTADVVPSPRTSPDQPGHR